MARADLLLSIIRSGSQGNQADFRRAVESLIAEERARQHHVLADQLADGGRLVLPVGDGQQTLQLIERSGSQLTSRILEPVRFVPLIDGDVE